MKAPGGPGTESQPDLVAGVPESESGCERGGFGGKQSNDRVESGAIHAGGVDPAEGFRDGGKRSEASGFVGNCPRK
jgi:hypothetical protein